MSPYLLILVFLVLMFWVSEKRNKLNVNSSAFSCFESAIEGFFFASCGLSLVGIICVELRTFTSAIVLFGFSIFAACAVIVSIFLSRKETNARTCEQEQHPGSRLTSQKFVFVALAIAIVVGAYFRFPASNYVIGGQDQGVYVNVGNHLAQTGSVFLRDPVLDVVRNAPPEQSHRLGRYMQLNYRNYATTADGRMRGTFAPGLYISDFPHSKLTPQFFHLHPIWVAFSQWFFGFSHVTMFLPVFGLMSVLLVYCLTQTLFRNQTSAISSAFLLAINPPHAYFSKFPVSEITASMFFLAGLMFLIRSRDKDRFLLLLSVLSFACLFFTRITGFVFVPVLLGYVLYRFSRNLEPSTRRRLLLFALGIIVVYAWSYAHGIGYSFQYSFDIYKKKLHLPRKILLHGHWYILATFIPFCLACLAVHHFRQPIRKFWATLAQKRNFIVLGIFVLLAATLGLLTYLLAYSDHFHNHRWFDRKWKIAGRGINSVWRMNYMVLLLFLTPVGVLGFLIGLWRTLLRSFYQRRFFLISVFSLFLLAVLTVKQLTSPFLYYFGRYLVSELVPLACVLGSYGFFVLSREIAKLLKLENAAFVYGMVAALTCANAALAIPYSLAHSKTDNGGGFFRSMDKLNSNLPSNALLLLDKDHLPLDELVTPFRMTFQKATYAVPMSTPKDLEVEDTARFFSERGFQVYLLSPKTFHSSAGKFLAIEEFRFSYRMIGQRTPRKLPNKASRRNYMVTLYQYQ